VDRASTAAGEEELGGVSIHVELVIGGNDFEAVVNDVLAEDGGPGFFISVAEPPESRVDAWHWAARCWGLGLFAVLVFQDQGKDRGGFIVRCFCYGS
jgi:hypothetical protein